ncbi:MAG: FAD-dependent oxidoreductase [Candidatus Hydrogenedentes bacterium]|nr:FAD-dependent oxidoreductase [Candidatus Hydrogenedentota bacterium]
MKPRFNRRAFLQSGALGAATALAPRFAVAQEQPSAPPAKPAPTSSLSADVVVVGGGLGGVAAALSLLMRGRSVILTEETGWIGGQSTAQAVPPDENKWIETTGGTRLYLEYRRRVREYYKRNYPLTDAARAVEFLNPGNGNVSRLCHEPRVSVNALHELFAPHIASTKLTLLLRHKPIAADTNGDRVTSVQVRSLTSGHDLTLEAPFFIDATELGDLLPMTKTEYVSGAEAKADTNELHAAPEYQPQNMQAFTCCFAMQYLDGEDHTIEKPAEYDFWRSYVPAMTPAWTGPLLDWQCCHPATLERRNMTFDPLEGGGNKPDFWLYRRILDRRNFVDGFLKGGVTLVNWPQNDYLLGSLIDVPEDEAQRHIARAKQLSLSLLYWMQTEAPRADGKTGWPGLKLRHDIVDTEDGLAKYPYIRESRRIKAEFTVLEQHVGLEARKLALGVTDGAVQAEQFPDSVGIGYYRIDLHPSSGGNNYIDVASLPFQIPLGALLPVRMENLLPACKNLGVTHITNGCYRLHPVEWNIGESAGALAAFCLAKNTAPKAIRSDTGMLKEFQSALTDQGVPLTWAEEARLA